MGLLLPSDTAPVATSATLTYAGLGAWVSARRDVAFGTDPDTMSLTYFMATPVLDVCALPDKVRFTAEARYSSRMGRGRDLARSDLCVTVEPVGPKSFTWFFDVGLKLEHFFSACVGSSVRLKAMCLRVGNDEGWLVRSRPRKKAGTPRPEEWIRCSGSQLAEALTNWFGGASHTAPFENLVYGTVRGASLFVETEFLSLAQALESFHRVTASGCLVSANEFAGIRESLHRAIEGCCAGPVATRLKEAVNHGNEPSFGERIDQMLSGLPASDVDKLLGDREKFGRAVRQTRNYLTHPGIRPGGQVLTDPGDLFLLNQKLHALLRFLLLTHWGFPPEIVFEPVYRQSRRWSVL